MIVEWMELFCTNDGVKICYLILENESLPFLDQKLFTETIFSRRFSREKCPTLTVASFFFFFFSSDYNLTLIGPLFLQSKLLKLLP